MTDRTPSGMAARVRRQVLTMVSRGNSSHIGSNLSIIEILVVLYSGILRVRPTQPKWPERDRFILSKGHGCAALYAVLAERDFFPPGWLRSFYQNGSPLAGHVTHTRVPGVEVSTGSLGHGLPIAAGMALAAKRDGKRHRVFCLLSDGECDEGSTWESALFAPHHSLDNLVAIVDYNRMQALGTTAEVLDLNPLAGKWQAFGWAVRDVDGHNLEELELVLSKIPYVQGRPNCIIAHTVKGKGVSFMENNLLWHYRSPRGAELEAAIAEVGGHR